MRISEEEYQVMIKGRTKNKKKSKYNSKKTVVDGITFDSKKEASRYKELKLMEQANEIKILQLQPRFNILKSFKHKGKTIRGVTYVADFLYVDLKTGKEVVEDTKGFKTDVYKIKKKYFLDQYGERFEFIEG